MEGMLATTPGTKRKRLRGAPLRAFTQQARAAGNAGLDAEQAAIVAAWLKLSPADQRAVIEDVLSQQHDEVTMEDISAVGGEEPQEAQADPAPEQEEPVVNADGGGQVVPGGLWEPEQLPFDDGE